MNSIFNNNFFSVAQTYIANIPTLPENPSTNKRRVKTLLFSNTLLLREVITYCFHLIQSVPHWIMCRSFFVDLIVPVSSSSMNEVVARILTCSNIPKKRPLLSLNLNLILK